MYVDPNFKSKAALKRAIAAGEIVSVFAPGMGTIVANGLVSLEGPHYPQPHTWYADGVMVNGKLTKVK